MAVMFWVILYLIITSHIRDVNYILNIKASVITLLKITKQRIKVPFDNY